MPTSSHPPFHSDLSPDGRFVVRKSRDQDGIHVPIIVEVKSGFTVGFTDIRQRGYEHVLWSPDSRSVALVGDYSTSHREVRVYTLTESSKFEQVEIDLPFPYGLYKSRNGGPGNFMVVRDDAYTLRWIDNRIVRLLNISWESGDTSISEWPKEWIMPVVGVIFSVSITGTEGKVSDIKLLGPMDNEDLLREAIESK